MDTYRHWFEKKLLEVGEDVRVINATEGGARIAHAEQMPFAEAMEQFAMVDELNVSSLWPAENEDWPRSFDQVRARVKQLQRQLSHIAGKADRIAATAAQLPEHKDTRQYRKLTRQIKDEGQKLYRRKDRAWVILGAFLAKQSFGVKHRAQLREDGETEEDFSPVAVAYYQSIAAASREASRRLKTALDVECERECGASETG